jgi:hypothetical protein
MGERSGGAWGKGCEESPAGDPESCLLKSVLPLPNLRSFAITTATARPAPPAANTPPLRRDRRGRRLFRNPGRLRFSACRAMSGIGFAPEEVRAGARAAFLRRRARWAGGPLSHGAYKRHGIQGLPAIHSFQFDRSPSGRYNLRNQPSHASSPRAHRPQRGIVPPRRRPHRPGRAPPARRDLWRYRRRQE